jgi:hypothetical protein
MARKVVTELNLTADLQVAGSSGTSGMLLTSAGSGAAPTWSSTPVVTGLTLSGATSTLTVNASVGTDGQVLISKGAGATPQWSSLSSTFTGGTLTSALILKSGASGAGAAPLYFGTTTPSLLSTPAAGAFEFDNVSPYFTNSTSVGRGVVPSINFFSLGSGRNLTDGTSTSSLFGKSLTVEANRTYYFKVVVSGTKGTTNSFVRFLFGGTATTSNVFYYGVGTNGTAPDTVTGRSGTSSAATNISTASTGTTWSYMIEGKFSVAAGSGGTWIPSCNFSATTGTTPTVTAGSYVYIYPISSTTTGDITIGAWA